jgi:hypothetical protein
MRLGLPTLAADDLWRDRTYLRLWSSILTSSFANQVMMLALPLTAAVLLQATPTQMGALTGIELLPFLLLSLPSGVWLDRVRKLPVYVVGESGAALAAASVPVAWWLGWLSMEWLYLVGFLLGTVHTVAGSAALVSMVLAAATIWLILTDPGTVARALADGSAEGFVRGLIDVIAAAIDRLLRWM